MCVANQPETQTYPVVTQGILPCGNSSVTIPKSRPSTLIEEKFSRQLRSFKFDALAVYSCRKVAPLTGKARGNLFEGVICSGKLSVQRNYSPLLRMISERTE